MNTIQLEELAFQDPLIKKCFAGVFALNQLPHKLEKNKIYYVNNEVEDLPGEHWYLISTKDPHEVDFFCSYGSRPKDKSIICSLQSRNEDVVYNKERVQAEFTATCGHHCVFVSYYLCRGRRLEEVIDSMYGEDLYKNDLLVYDFITKVFKLKNGPPLLNEQYFSAMGIMKNFKKWIQKKQKKPRKQSGGGVKKKKSSQKGTGARKKKRKSAPQPPTPATNPLGVTLAKRSGLEANSLLGTYLSRTV